MIQAQPAMETQGSGIKMSFEVAPDCGDIVSAHLHQFHLIQLLSSILSHELQNFVEPCRKNIRILLGLASFASSQSCTDRFLAGGKEDDVLDLWEFGFAGWQTVDACRYDADIESTVVRGVVVRHRIDHFLVALLRHETKLRP